MTSRSTRPTRVAATNKTGSARRSLAVASDNADANPRATAIAMLLLVALGLVLWAVVIGQQSIVLAGIDAEDYAQMGRQIASGAGFTSLFLPLNGLAWLQQHGASLEPPWPNISRFPLPPLVMAAIFRAVGPSDYAAAGYSLIGYLAGAPFALLIGRRVGGTLLGALAGLLYLVHPDTLQLSYSGLTEPVTTAILVATAWLALRADSRSHWVAGALYGLAYWNRTTLLALALPIAALIWFTAKDRRASLIGFVAAASVIPLPWMAITFATTGSPLFNLQNATVLPFGTESGPQDFPWYVFAFQPASETVGGALAKWWSQFLGLRDVLPETLGPIYLLALAAVGVWQAPNDARKLRWVLAGWLAIQIGVYSFAGNVSRFYTIFQPFIQLFGLIGCLWLAGRVWSRRSSAVVALALVALVALPSVGALSGRVPFGSTISFDNVNGVGVQGEPPRRGDPVSAIVDASPENGAYIASVTRPNDLVLSNLPWSVAWRAQRPSTPLPPRPTDVADFEQRTGLRVAAIYLTPQMFIVGVPASWREWNLLRDRNQTIPGFRLDRRFRDGAVLLLRE